MRHRNPYRKIETDELVSLSIFSLKARGCLVLGNYNLLQWQQPYTGEQLKMVISTHFKAGHYWMLFSQGAAGVAVEYCVKLETTGCNFGGVRFWFQCPNYLDRLYCGRRVGVLYMTGNTLACRKCLNLTYPSQTFNHRFWFYPEVYCVLLGRKAKHLVSQIKRFTYAGKPTRNVRRVLAIQEKTLR